MVAYGNDSNDTQAVINAQYKRLKSFQPVQQNKQKPAQRKEDIPSTLKRTKGKSYCKNFPVSNKTYNYFNPSVCDSLFFLATE